MKIICTKADLVKSINTSLRAVSSRSTLPVLECILVQAENNQIHFISNNTELGIDTKVIGMVMEPGKVAIPAKIFSEIVRKLPDTDITITADKDHNVMIVSGKAKFAISGQSGEDFTYLPEVEREKGVKVSKEKFSKLIAQTIFSISTTETNKLMTGELVEINDRNLRMVSLDGHRISIRNMELEEAAEAEKIIVPGKTLNEINKLPVDDSDDTLYLYFTKNHILFETSDTVMVSRLIEGEYFSYEKMMNDSYEIKLIVDRQKFINCLDRSLLFVKEGDKRPIILDITDTNCNINISSALGTMNEDIEVEKTGKDIAIGFNPRFLMDALRAIDDEKVTLHMTNGKSPCYISDAEKTYTYFVLPVNFVRNR